MLMHRDHKWIWIVVGDCIWKLLFRTQVEECWSDPDEILRTERERMIIAKLMHFASEIFINSVGIPWLTYSSAFFSVHYRIPIGICYSFSLFFWGGGVMTCVPLAGVCWCNTWKNFSSAGTNASKGRFFERLICAVELSSPHRNEVL